MPTIRARDLRSNIKELGFERGIVVTLEAALEEVGELRQHMRQLTALTGECIDRMQQFVQIGEAMRETIETIKREQKGGPDGDAC